MPLLTNEKCVNDLMIIFTNIGPKLIEKIKTGN